MTLTQSYVPFGNVPSSVGDGVTVFQFVGEAKDSPWLYNIHLPTNLDKKANECTRQLISAVYTNIKSGTNIGGMSILWEPNFIN